jgi:hypothetical protein
MKIGVSGSKGFSDYAIFLRAMGTALASIPEGDTSITIFTVGPYKVNDMTMEFANVSERGLKARGISVRVVKISQKWLKSNMGDIDHFIYLSLPKEPLSDLVREAEDKDIFVGVYRY